MQTSQQLVSTSAGRQRFHRILPRWYIDLDGALKPIAVVGVVLLVCVPMLAIALSAGQSMAEADSEISRLVALNPVDVGAVNVASEQFHDASARASWALMIAALWALVFAVGGAWISAILAADWI